MSQKASAELQIAEALDNTLRGFLLSEDPDLGNAAAARRVKLAPELRKLREMAARTAELPFTGNRTKANAA